MDSALVNEIIKTFLVFAMGIIVGFVIGMTLFHPESNLSITDTTHSGVQKVGLYLEVAPYGVEDDIYIVENNTFVKTGAKIERFQTNKS